jgi:hypothetical protein
MNKQKDAGTKTLEKMRWVCKIGIGLTASTREEQPTALGLDRARTSFSSGHPNYCERFSMMFTYPPRVEGG